MNLTTMPERNLEETILIMSAKEMRKQDLQNKLDVLKANKRLKVSYTLDLTKEEQIKYANIGMFYYWFDLNGKSKLYK